jgi:hypothetical protein
MAPVLFLFLMSAFAETLETKWKNAGIGVCMVRSVIGEKLLAGKGKLRGHLPKITFHKGLQQWKFSNACMMMMEHSYFHPALT